MKQNLKDKINNLILQVKQNLITRLAAEKVEKKLTNNNQQPQLVSIDEKYLEYRKKRNEEGKKAVEEMMKQPYTFEQAMENLARLKEQGLNILSEKQGDKNFYQIKQSIRAEFIKLNNQQQKEVINDLGQLSEESAKNTNKLTDLQKKALIVKLHQISLSKKEMQNSLSQLQTKIQTKEEYNKSLEPMREAYAKVVEKMLNQKTTYDEAKKEQEILKQSQDKNS